MSIDIIKSRLIQYPLKKGQYIEVDKAKAKKKQIILHHTAGGSAKSSIDYWNNSDEQVGTAFVIDRQGSILQAFPSWCWAYALGVNQYNYRQLEQQSIQIELANYGQLKKYGNDTHHEFYSAYGNKIAPDIVEKLPISFRGSIYYEKYSAEQIDSLILLIRYLADAYNIDVRFKSDIFDINQRALRGDGGLYTHCSFRADKSDIYPQIDLINALKTL
jgi:N-acetyl-anhydromuramyl-L-alanine amidase AmpD